MENQIFIPTKLKVGYQKRLDTYSKKLAYVIYYDDKGKLRKETSWKGWIDKKQGINEFDNVPTEGFVLNRNVGGVKNSYRYDDVRIEKVRVYDPRGFEFEIDIPNVLTILQECTSTKGKGLEGTFVYGWNGPSLVLIPTTSNDYEQSQKYTALQSGKVEAKKLIVGASYKTKKQKDLIYLGKFDWIEQKWGRSKNGWIVEKKHIFVDENSFDDYELDLDNYDSEKEYERDLKKYNKERADAIKRGDHFEFIPLSSTATLALCNSETPVSNYAYLLDKFNNTINASIPVSFIEKKTKFNTELKFEYYWRMKSDINDKFYLKVGPNHYTRVYIRPHDAYNNNVKFKPQHFELIKDRVYQIIDGVFSIDHIYEHNNEDKYTVEQLTNMEVLNLSVKLNNNEVINVNEYI